jgi:hypothetical protein
MNIQHEFWRAVASGLLDAVVAEIATVTNRDSRRVLVERRAFHGGLFLDAYASLAYVIDQETVDLCFSAIDDVVYNPHVREAVPRPQNAASDGTTLSCDNPGTGYTAMVYAWDFVTFSEVGPLADNSQPATGYYVLAIKEDGSGEVGLPSPFLEIV